MRARAPCLVAAGALTVVAACDASRESNAPAPFVSASPVGPSLAVPSGTSSSEPPPSAPAPDPPSASPIERALRAGAITSLAPRAADGYVAILHTADGPREIVARLGTARDPTPRRRALAYYTLARELGLDVVPVEVARPLPLALVARLLPDLVTEGDDRVVVLNDGTVPVVLAASGTAEAGDPWNPFPSPRSGYFPSLPERSDWMRQAASAVALPGENPRTLRAFVGALVLEYLAAHLLRKDVVVGETREGRTTLILADNDTAFPPRADPRALDRLLEPLRSVRRFPKELAERLHALDRARIDAVFSPASFETMLLPPRDRLELGERIAALATLLASRIEMGGRQAVLCL